MASPSALALLADLRRHLDSITCLSGEGPDTIELHEDQGKARRELWRAICDEGLAGLKLVAALLPEIAHLRAARGGGAWRREPPTVAGVYLFRRGAQSQVQGVEVDSAGLATFSGCELEYDVTELSGEWAPCLPPADAGGAEVAADQGTVVDGVVMERRGTGMLYVETGPFFTALRKGERVKVRLLPAPKAGA